MNAASPEPIQLLLVDDHAMFRQCLARVLAKERDFAVAGQCGSSEEALAQLAERATSGTAVDIVLLDVDLGPERAIDFVLKANKRGFSGRILIVTAGVGGAEAVQLVQAGVAGILHKHHSVEVLCETIRLVAGGEVYLEPQYMNSLFRTVDRTRTPTQTKLTERDKIVLRFVFQGLTNKEISGHLEISESGAKSALRQLFSKLGVRTRAQLVRIALEQYRDQL